MRHAIGVFTLIAVNGGWIAYQAASPATAVIALGAAFLVAFIVRKSR